MWREATFQCYLNKKEACEQLSDVSVLNLHSRVASEGWSKTAYSLRPGFMSIVIYDPIRTCCSLTLKLSCNPRCIIDFDSVACFSASIWPLFGPTPSLVLRSPLFLMISEPHCTALLKMDASDDFFKLAFVTFLSLSNLLFLFRFTGLEATSG